MQHVLPHAYWAAASRAYFAKARAAYTSVDNAYEVRRRCDPSFGSDQTHALPSAEVPFA